MITTTKSITLGESITDIEPKRPELSSNGGDYYFGRYPVIVDEAIVGYTQWTSSEFDYCEITGAFTKTRRVTVEGTNIVLMINEQALSYYDYETQQYDYQEELSQEEFLNWIKNA